MRRVSILAGVSLATLAALGTRPPAVADLVITGGMLWTGASLDAAKPGAVAIAGDRILAVGDSARVARYVGPKTQILSAHGGLIMPGFADSHTHFVDGGFQLASIDLRSQRYIDLEIAGTHGHRRMLVLLH